jgi:uncharacterized protein (DUF1810 family)
LERFVAAQGPVIDGVYEELRAGAKHGHWMWFIFPQIAGLGHSPTARRYAITSRAEAVAFLDHAVLGPRLVQCTRLVNGVEGRSALDIFGPIDALKFRSSMTLFAAAALGMAGFADALRRYFGGEGDSLTLAKLGG